jgi:hypothetical protein
VSVAHPLTTGRQLERMRDCFKEAVATYREATLALALGILRQRRDPARRTLRASSKRVSVRFNGRFDREGPGRTQGKSRALFPTGLRNDR